MGGLVGLELLVEHALVRRMHVDEDEPLGALRKNVDAVQLRERGAERLRRVAAGTAQDRARAAASAQGSPACASAKSRGCAAAAEPCWAALRARTARRAPAPRRGCGERLLDARKTKSWICAAVAKAHLELGGMRVDVDQLRIEAQIEHIGSRWRP